MTWILTSTGKKFDYLIPRAEDIDILDIANGLANEARFAGQTREFYSVAQHSVIPSLYVQTELAREVLLHDASEAYCKDIPRPLKHLLQEYISIEQGVMRAIRERFGLPQSEANQVKYMDLVMLATEKRDLMPLHEHGDDDWPILDGIPPLVETIKPWTPAESRERFLHRFHSLFPTYPEITAMESDQSSSADWNRKMMLRTNSLLGDDKCD